MIFIVIGIWLYAVQSLLPSEDESSPQKIILKEGTLRTDVEIAEALAYEMGFDLEGAYRTGYTTGDIIDYLKKEPHKYSFSVYQGKYYEGRITLAKMIPLAAGIICIMIGILVLLLKGRSKKHPESSRV
ncbi:MAG: hypothetical protein C4538_01915 [Nitrospiraceae bacterium]|nr:MAG: hypothetical protein C4538_01915 [Nitrospiraceae bacterium]